MSQRGRGAGTGGDDAEDPAAASEHSEGSLLPPASARPIEPYDPYRPRGESLPRLSGRGAADPLGPPPRRPVRPASQDPFLPDDDPLNADSWQLELDAPATDDLPVAPEPRATPPRARRPASAPRTERTADAAARPGRRSRARTETPRTTSTRPAITIGVPRVVSSSPLVADSTALILLGIGVASVLVMAVLLGIRLGGMPSPAVLHLDAAGNPDLWGPPSVLWRLPLMSFFLTVMFLVVAWFLYPVDRFAARFALAAPIMAQIIAWVAVMQHLA